MFAVFATCFHLAMSPFTIAANASGELPTGSPPSVVMRSWISGCCTIFATSPHNPTGPVCTAASLHVALAAPAVDSLELQLGESALAQDVVRGDGPRCVDGCFAATDGPGWGIELDVDELNHHPCRPVPPGLDERLG